MRRGGCAVGAGRAPCPHPRTQRSKTRMCARAPLTRTTLHRHHAGKYAYLRRFASEFEGASLAVLPNYAYALALARLELLLRAHEDGQQ